MGGRNDLGRRLGDAIDCQIGRCGPGVDRHDRIGENQSGIVDVGRTASVGQFHPLPPERGRQLHVPVQASSRGEGHQLRLTLLSRRGRVGTRLLGRIGRRRLYFPSTLDPRRDQGLVVSRRIQKTPGFASRRTGSLGPAGYRQTAAAAGFQQQRLLARLPSRH
mmetsp:Transcript_58/g.68  ORF Transcript_58/g.68 Transcript_58/m.68 type:complete len:163 (+) Transcript_58:907-1395(+)